MGENMINYINKWVTNYHTVFESKKELLNLGFKELSITDKFDLKSGEKYVMSVYDTTLVAFTIPKDLTKFDLRVAVSHTDSPVIKVKPSPVVKSDRYNKLNVAVYGGAIYNTWLDRPLSLAGKVVLKGDNPFNPKNCLIDFEKPLFIIPNLAIHHNREINKGLELNPQIDLLPLCSVNTEEDLLELISKKLNVKKEDILDFDLNMYLVQKGMYLGVNEEFIASSRIDNLSSCYAVLEAIKEATDRNLNIIVMFDNEEIGSRSKQGADSILFRDIIERIYDSLNVDKVNIYNGFALSLDVAHAMHPNKPEKCDITNKPHLNDGFCIKVDVKQSYSSDATSHAIVKELANKCGAKWVTYINRSDVAGGGTLGPILNKYLPIRTVDIGIPILAMHSSMETCGKDDIDYLVKLIKEFFKN